MCDAEVRLNRRTAPTLYRGVVPVTREPMASFALDGARRAVDWLVEMNRFEQEALFDRLAAARGSTSTDGSARRRHRRSAHGRRTPRRPWGHGRHGLGHRRQRRRLRRVTGDRVSTLAVRSRDRLARAELKRQASLLDARRASGGSVSVMATFTCAISSCSTAARRCSTASSSTTRSPASTSCTISRSC